MGYRFGGFGWLALVAAVACSSGGKSSKTVSPDAGGAGIAGGAAAAANGGTNGSDQDSGTAVGVGTGTDGGDNAAIDAGTSTLPTGVLPCLPVPSGTPLAADPSFQPHGPFVGGLSWLGGEAKLDRKGRLVVLGEIAFVDASARARLVRFDANGDPENDFTTPLVYAFPGSGIYPKTLAFDDQNRIYIGGGLIDEPGNVMDRGLILRLLETGALDATFAASGNTPGMLAFVPGGKTPQLDADISTLAYDGTGFFAQVRDEYSFAHVFADGTVDTAFKLQLLSGHVVFLGDTLYTAEDSIRAFTRSGDPLTSFGNAGTASIDGYSAMQILIELADHRLAGVSYVGSVARFSADGHADTTYGTSGFTAASHCTPLDVRVLCDGRIAFVGKPTDTMDTSNCAVVFDEDGQPPADIPASGHYTLGSANGSRARSLLFDNGGRVLAVSTATDGSGETTLQRFSPPWSRP